MAESFNTEADPDGLNFQQLTWYEDRSNGCLLEFVFLRLRGQPFRGDKTLNEINSRKENILVLYATNLDAVENPIHKSDPHGFRLISKRIRLYLVEVGD